ncbi:MAG: hypothetical protein ACI92A_000889 [Candidatus Paceibacteria bacterium]|jgi:hypothetical protein
MKDMLLLYSPGFGFAVTAGPVRPAGPAILPPKPEPLLDQDRLVLHYRNPKNQCVFHAIISERTIALSA